MGGYYTDNGQYDHHVWLYRTYQELKMDLLCYGSCFTMVTSDGVERLDPRNVIIQHV
jgi:hypothetical protein